MGLPNYLTAQQVTRLIEAARPGRDRALLAVMYQFGLRRGEVEMLDRDDFMPHRGRNGVLRVRRLKRRGPYVQEEPMWGRTKRLVMRYLNLREDEEDALFRSRRGGPLQGQAIYYVYRRAAEAAGLPSHLRHPHCLRHSIATHYCNMGTSLPDIQGFLAHDRIDSTMIYAQILTPRKRRRVLHSEHSTYFAIF